MPADELLAAVCVGLGGMGVIYSLVLRVFPQYGVTQVVKRAGEWRSFLESIGPGQNLADRLAQSDPGANEAVYRALLDGTKCGTKVDSSRITYVDLAVNPITHECWVTHRSDTDVVPMDVFKEELDMDQLEATIVRNVNSVIQQKDAMGAILNYLGYLDPRYGTLFFKASVLGDDVKGLVRTIGWLANQSNLNMAAVAALAAQAEGHIQTDEVDVAGRWNIAGNMLTATLDALMGVGENGIGKSKAVSHKTGDIGWPDGGLAGSAIEISLAPDKAFSFIHNELLYGPHPVLGRNPRTDTLFLGYLSVRFCKRTRTLLGMQQFDPHSIMVELVANRSPGAVPFDGEAEPPAMHEVFTRIERRVLELNRTAGLGALLHWGLQCEAMTAEDLQYTPLGRGAPHTNLDKFRAARARLGGGRFDNWAIRRLGLVE